MSVSPDEVPIDMWSVFAILKSILSSVSAVIEVSASASKINSEPFKSVGVGAIVVAFVLSLIT